MLVSGGFTYFADWVCQALGIDYARSKGLELPEGVRLPDARKIVQDFMTNAAMKKIKRDAEMAVAD